MTGNAAELFGDLIDQLLESWPMPGGFVAVVDAHGTLFSREFGRAAPASARPLDDQQLFEIGSISKVITALALHQLIEAGLFTLDTDIRELLPWLDFGRGAPVTVRHLLHHTSGIISGADAVPDQVAQAWSLRDRERRAAPGEMFHYSNLGYIVLGLAAAHVTGESLASLVESRVLRPLGLENSIARVTHNDRARFAPGSEPLSDDRPWLPGDPLGAATWLEVDGADGNVAMPIADVARFTRMLLGRGTLDGTSVVSRPTFEGMIGDIGPGGEDTLALLGVPASTSSNYGLGINVERVDGRLVVTHGGGMVGYASFVLADLDAGVGVAVLTNANGDSPIAEVIARSAAALWAAQGTSGDGSWHPALWSTIDAPLDQRPRPVSSAPTGRFSAVDGAGSVIEVTVQVEPRDASTAGLSIDFDGVSAPLLWGWGNRIVTEHPKFRQFAFEYDVASHELAWGELVFRRIARAAVAPGLHPEIVGHYRSYSPWFSNFRIVDREGGLVLIAAMGVEAPGEDTPLVALGEGRYRMGTDERLAETLIVGPVVDGRVIYIDRDGCRYSRSFTN